MGDHEYWQAVIRRDPEYDGRFVYAVRSTGIYCRPSCPSRRPKRENVQFFALPVQAEQAGFRACQRCQPDKAVPDEPHLGLVQAICRYLAEPREHIPTLNELAQQFNLSPYHLQRTFKRIVGVTPHQYAAGHRLERFKESLKDEETVTEALYEAGYLSSRQRNDADLGPWVTTLLSYLNGGQPHFDLPLDVQATAFQRRVWESLQTIPYGSTRSYQKVAEVIGQPAAVRAVARACATNPVALVIPCHRVIREDGTLGGYRWGLARKQALLDMESEKEAQP
jgi:AraC family transcriptional regulator of adaptative response/methylated-DNA-[protein]-cysteine methyltransferase